MSFISENINKIENENIFLGGPRDLFEEAGRKMLMLLLNEGLNPYSKILDIGCGCLRGGYWLIQFLNESSYFGIEPNQKMLLSGINNLLNPDMVSLKKPIFDNNDDFNTKVFNIKFDFFLARSIWTHASKEQICTMLDEFNLNTTENGIFLTSYIKASSKEDDYNSIGWVGKSHKSNVAGIVKHKLNWIQHECKAKKLVVQEINNRIFNLNNNQRWLKITKNNGEEINDSK